MRRTLAGLLFAIAYLCAGLAVSGWLLQRTAFDPDRSSSASSVVLGDDEIRNELIDVIENATVATLADQGIDESVVRTNVRRALSIPQGAVLMAEVLHDAHAHLIGAQTEPVQITGPQMVPIVGYEAAAVIPPITLPVPRVAALDWTRRVLVWLVPISALVAVVFALIGLTAHPERVALIRSLGFGLLLLAGLVALLGYVVPRFVLPLLSDSPWAHVPVTLANDSLPMLIGVVLLLVGAGLALLVGSGAMQRRRRWSTPVSTYRYNEERRWS